MPRTTRKQRDGGGRLTRKAQVGGASWYVISDSARKATWDSVLDGGPLRFLTSGSDWRTGPDAMKRYGTLLARQDELMAAARQCMMKSANIDETTPAKDVVAAVSAVNVAYLDDVFSFIAFGDAVKSGSNTKTAQLKQNVLDCILFPKRVENLLVYAIASIIVNLKRNPQLLIDAAADEKLKTILVRQCKSFYYQLVYEQTANEPIDTLHMRQEVGSVDSFFWTNFLTACINILPSSETRFTPVQFYNIAAGIFHKIPSNNIIDDVFASVKGPGKSDPIHTAAPDSSVWDKNITNTITYKQFLLNGYSPKHIEFLFHLAYTVQKILDETGVLPAIQISASGSAPGAAGATNGAGGTPAPSTDTGIEDLM